MLQLHPVNSDSFKQLLTYYTQKHCDGRVRNTIHIYAVSVACRFTISTPFSVSTQGDVLIIKLLITDMQQKLISRCASDRLFVSWLSTWYQYFVLGSAVLAHHDRNKRRIRTDHISINAGSFNVNISFVISLDGITKNT